ncbi:MAG: hypothetical protein H6550_07120 [Chitinophagales bacterium]|nr:hypothetical protein [Chitinophagales bacterium]
MKKLIPIILTAVAVLSLSSCFKVWTCRCDITVYDTTYITPNSSAEITAPGFKKDMKKDCDVQKARMESWQGVTQVDCTVK